MSTPTCNAETNNCDCPITHPAVYRLATPALWRLLPGRVQGWIVGPPCWLGAA